MAHHGMCDPNWNVGPINPAFRICNHNVDRPRSRQCAARHVTSKTILMLKLG